MQTKPLFLFFLCILTLAMQAQKKYTISGYLKDSQTGESLIGANLYCKNHEVGTVANPYGFYSLTLPQGKVDLIFSYVGYATQEISFVLSKDTLLTIPLAGTLTLKEIEVTAQAIDRIETKTQMSSITLPVAQIKSMPAFMGEVDLIKAIQMLPGVQAGSEGNSGMYVRGGGPDQNLILLDGVPVYNVSHLFGFFSVFNADAVNNVELFKGGFPARYGGRASSVLDINLKEGNMKEFHGEGSIGLVSSKLTLEGPIWKDHTSFIVSGRRTYIDLLMKPLIKAASDDVDAGYYFYDLTAKINHRFSDKDRIYLSAYMGDDKFHVNIEENYEGGASQTKTKSGLKWGNITSAFRWNHIYNAKLFGNTTLTYSRFRFNTGGEGEEKYTPPGNATEYSSYKINYNSLIEDLNAKISFDYMPSPNHYIRLGGNFIYHKFTPGVMAVKTTENIADTSFRIGSNDVFANEMALYAEDDFSITSKLKVNYGLHWSGFAVRNTFYQTLQPRVSARYLLRESLSLKASYSKMAQYIHLLTNSSTGLPTDLWVPSTEVLKPQYSDQIAIGTAKSFKEKYEISLEAYYKTMDNLLEYREGASFFDMDGRWESKVLQGKGDSYGLELFLQKKTGKLSGFVGYTLSWTNRIFEELNNGRQFPYKYDRRHDISISVLYKATSHIEVSGTWVYGTGNATTIPVAIYDDGSTFTYPGTEIRVYGDRNAFRLPAYHRLDLAASFIKQKKWGERRWIFGLYNAYNRKNPFFIDVESRTYHEGDKTYTENKFYQYSLFPLIPSISYNFKF